MSPLCQVGHLGSGTEPWQGARPHTEPCRKLRVERGPEPLGVPGRGSPGRSRMVPALCQLLPVALPKCCHLPKASWQSPSGNGAPLGPPWVRHCCRRVHPVRSACWALNAGGAGTCRPAAAAHGLFSHIFIQMLILWMPL